MKPKIDLGELTRDAIAIGGLIIFAAGVWIQFGAGWALIAAGVVLLALVLWGRK